MDEVVDATSVEEEAVGNELVQTDSGATLFRTDDPQQVIERASAVADQLRGVLSEQNLTVRISGREHVLVEGWQTVGSMLGVFPIEDFTNELPAPLTFEMPEGKAVYGFEARYVAQTIDGRIVGAGRARCTRGERTWKSREDFALESMAQTRAQSKAMQACLRWIVTLAGYSGTGAEEMQADQPNGPEATVQLRGTTFQALMYLLDDEESVKRVMEDIAACGEGYLPRVAAQAVVLTAKYVKTAHEGPTPEETDGDLTSDPPDEPDEPEPSEPGYE